MNEEMENYRAFLKYRITDMEQIQQRIIDRTNSFNVVAEEYDNIMATYSPLFDTREKFEILPVLYDKEKYAKPYITGRKLVDELLEYNKTLLNVFNNYKETNDITHLFENKEKYQKMYMSLIGYLNSLRNETAKLEEFNEDYKEAIIKFEKVYYNDMVTRLKELKSQVEDVYKKYIHIKEVNGSVLETPLSYYSDALGEFLHFYNSNIKTLSELLERYANCKKTDFFKIIDNYYDSKTKCTYIYKDYKEADSAVSYFNKKLGEY